MRSAARAFALFAIVVVAGSVARAGGTDGRSPWWVFLNDKGPAAPREGAPGWDDVPLYAPYVADVARIAEIRHELSWFNAASVNATPAELDSLRALPFVVDIQQVARISRTPTPEPEVVSASSSPRNGRAALNYGNSYNQNHAMGADALHALGFSGKGIIVAVLDDGFSSVYDISAFDSLNILGAKSFIQGSTSILGGNHGTEVLSTLAAYYPGVIIGSAWRAGILLARTEMDSLEVPAEEDNWAAGIQWAVENGADVVTSSLGYNYFDDAPAASHSIKELDGKTAIITRAADKAAGKGVVVLNCAGNERGSGGISGWQGKLLFPADGDSVIAVGATYTNGLPTNFTSMGPTADGRTKPDVAAVGSSVYTVLGYGSGTSFSTPLTAGVAAMLLEAHPGWDPIAVRTALRMSGQRALAPDDSVGWGLINGKRALGADSAFFGRLVGPAGTPVTSSRVRIVNGEGTTLATATVSAGGWFRIEHLVAGNYRLRAYYPNDTIGFDSAVTIPRLPRELALKLGDPSGIDGTPHPEKFWVGSPFPNPANPTVSIPFRLADARSGDMVTVLIASAAGQIVRRDAVSAGTGVYAWDGRDDAGKAVGSGTWIARISASGVTEARKFVLLR